MCLEEQKIPSKSQIALALFVDVLAFPLFPKQEDKPQHMILVGKDAPLRIEVIQETTAVLLVEDTSESPWLVMERLNVLDFYQKYIARFRCLDVEWTRQVVYPIQIDISEVIGRVVVSNLTSSPVHAFNLDHFIVGDLGRGGNYLIALRCQRTEAPQMV
jgi:hypothetical protein